MHVFSSLNFFFLIEINVIAIYTSSPPTPLSLSLSYFLFLPHFLRWKQAQHYQRSSLKTYTESGIRPPPISIMIPPLSQKKHPIQLFFSPFSRACKTRKNNNKKKGFMVINNNRNHLLKKKEFTKKRLESIPTFMR